ncbi:hypothetical protein AB0F42_00410 [Streptomyces buecherae]|uniref:hypothetical protein n=1 Tax=Streptomyces buecherae TaxID=2763006 RepID=UPI0033EF1FB4
MSDGFAWIAEAGGGGGTRLVAVRGVDVERLAVMLGAEPGTLPDGQPNPAYATIPRP